MANEHQFQLDHSRPRRKYTCPTCGASRRFTRYVDMWGQITFPDHVGRCDREQKCGYNYTPRDYFRDNPHLCSRSLAVQPPRVVKPQPQRMEPMTIPADIVTRSLSHYEMNPFYQFLTRLYGPDEADRLTQLYRIGTSKRWGGATVFWQIDAQGRARSGKIMRYDPRTGRRVKDGSPAVTWVHSALRMYGFDLSQCYFGEHLLPLCPDHKVMIVESEKTAVVCAHAMPQFVWLATGGLCNLRPSMALKGRDVYLVPDLGGEERWSAKIPDLRGVCHSVTLWPYLRDRASTEQHREGLDLADFLLSDYYFLLTLEEKNPEVRRLVEAFHCTIPNL
ncbi:MAG: DUF6371 domain-containing protein [Bacteroidales bacterium]|nr:DUF6371 domain-containing protein [Bacteroidales bacterium]MCD8395185.1 DUF6371 domain-containing protein [Bacteroidales bacterium]